MRFLKSFENIRLDVVGIIAVLGEGSVTRNSQCSALSWHNFLPRLFPAPQALLETERKKRLPTAPGVVAGAYNGNIRHEYVGDFLKQREKVTCLLQNKFLRSAIAP